MFAQRVNHMHTPWYTVSNVADIPSPALLVYPDRVEENIRRMIAVAGGVGRLRPHMKTNKLPEVVRMHIDQGITKFKCATIAEAEMAATAGAPTSCSPISRSVRTWNDSSSSFARSPRRRSQRWWMTRARSARCRTPRFATA